ncbi:(2Fe-2S) ferredoxin domain-containing protein [Eubacteriaceae bacterium ES3]|nr:(2Fe-2S) ferredoxin domain-containing protein [Eubacteriaceae bacterium ES3]
MMKIVKLGKNMKMIKVCIGSSCHVRGSYQVVQIFKRLLKDKNLQEDFVLEGSFCMGHCQDGVSVECEGNFYSVTEDTAEFIFTQITGEK